MDFQKAKEYLAERARAGCSSPAGSHWADFWSFLKNQKEASDEDPKRPLILAASGESDATKHRRLEEQLRWAADHGCLPAALEFLKSLDNTAWNHCPKDQWTTESYPEWDIDVD